MRSKDPKLMLRIRDYVEKYYFEKQRLPSQKNIAAALNISTGTVYKYLVAMNDRGLISYRNGKIETDKISKVSPAFDQVGILGPISCGIPDTVEAYVESYIPLPKHIFGSGEKYILIANGDSMIEAGIDNGDFVVVRRQNQADIGDIVVALVDGANTLKRIIRDDNGQYFLHPENSYMDDIPIDINELTIQGVAINVIKNLR